MSVNKSYILTGFADEIAPEMSKQYELLHKLGINRIELRGVDGRNISELSHSDVSELKKELDAEGISISAIGSPLGKIKITDDFSSQLVMLSKLIDFAVILGTPLIRVFSFYTDGENEKHRDAVMQRIEAFVEEATSRDVVLLHENEKGIYGDTPERCLDLMERFYCPHFKCTFDFANFVQCGCDTLKAYEMLDRYIEYVHIKDALKNGGHVVPAGMGDGNLEAILTKLFARGYHGYLSLEPHLSHFHGLDALERGEDKNDKLPGDVAFTTAYNALDGLIAKILKKRA